MTRPIALLSALRDAPLRALLGARTDKTPHGEEAAERPSRTMRRVEPTRRWIVALILGGALLPLVGCARKNRPVHPPESDYPRTYPTE